MDAQADDLRGGLGALLEFDVGVEDEIADAIRGCGDSDRAQESKAAALGLDPVWWTSSERGIRCRPWRTRRQHERDGASRMSAAKRVWSPAWHASDQGAACPPDKCTSVSGRPFTCGTIQSAIFP
jgi:hypothetical protein